MRDLTPEQEQQKAERQAKCDALQRELNQIVIARRRIVRALDELDEEDGPRLSQKREEDYLPGGNASLKSRATFVRGDTLNLRGATFSVIGVARHTLTLRLLPRF